MILSIVFGSLCGIALGLTGGGGSILAVPLLVYGLSVSFHSAVTISLLVVGLTALFGFLPKVKSGEVEISAGITLAITGMLFAPIGSYISTFINSQLLLILFSLLMILIGVWSIFKARFIKDRKAQKDSACSYSPEGKLLLTKKCKSVLLLSGIITGVLTGLFGIGGGFLIVPALILTAKMPMKKAVSTSLLIIFLVSISGFVSHITHTSINIYITTLFIVGSIIGMFFALKIKDQINNKVLQGIFSALVIVVGITMLIKQLY